MADFYKGTIPIIDTESNAFNDVLYPKDATFGLVPRDYSTDPEEMFSPPSDMQLIPESEWDARFDEQEELKSSLEHIYLSGPNGEPAFPTLDQNGHGYCWAYSVGHAIMIDRLRRNLPLVRLNPHSVAAIIKRGRDEGGWCGLSAKFARENGYGVEGNGSGQWPLHSRDLRHDTPAALLRQLSDELRRKRPAGLCHAAVGLLEWRHKDGEVVGARAGEEPRQQEQHADRDRRREDSGAQPAVAVEGAQRSIKARLPR